MNILAIGNSFSQDATRYLHRIARSDGFDLKVTNLYIGGCSLERHFRNMLSEDKAYGLESNGEITGFFVSLKEALLNRNWDYITIQQASHFSPDYNTYHPVMKANDFEEGTGHHSMIKEDGQWYAVYHARDYENENGASAFDARNARICKLHINDGIITAERYEDHI